MNPLIIRRFIVYDDLGPLRAFYSKQDALRFIGNRKDLTLHVLPKPPKPRLDLSQFEDALF